jgi:hypothetical protein
MAGRDVKGRLVFFGEETRASEQFTLLRRNSLFNDNISFNNVSTSWLNDMST